MKLKEAQMLGILALIAVGIILLCMWGGEEEVATSGFGEAGGPPDIEASLEPSIADLYQDLMREDEPARQEAPVSRVEETTVQIGGLGPHEQIRPTEEAVIRRVIEETAPEEIPLTPRREAVEEPAPHVAPAPAPRPRTHVVERGETLSEISQKHYGTSTKWQDVLKANRNVVTDPRLLRPGMKLKIPVLADVASAGSSRPALNAAASAAPTASRTYTVQKGDTLFRIAMKCYDDGTRWRDIQEANRQAVDDPKKLRPGMVLLIP
jgi:LysM repeat protein